MDSDVNSEEAYIQLDVVMDGTRFILFEDLFLNENEMLESMESVCETTAHLDNNSSEFGDNCFGSFEISNVLDMRSQFKSCKSSAELMYTSDRKSSKSNSSMIPETDMLVVDNDGERYICNYEPTRTASINNAMFFCFNCNKNASNEHICKYSAGMKHIDKKIKYGKSKGDHQRSRKYNSERNTSSKPLVKSKNNDDLNISNSHFNIDGLRTVKNVASLSSTEIDKNENKVSIKHKKLNEFKLGSNEMDFIANQINEKLIIPALITPTKKKQSSSTSIDNKLILSKCDDEIDIIIKLLETIHTSREYLGFIGSSMKSLLTEAKNCKFEKKTFDNILKDKNTYSILKVCSALINNKFKNEIINKSQNKQITDTLSALEELINFRRKVFKCKRDRPIPLIVCSKIDERSNYLSHFIKAFKGYRGLSDLQLEDFIALCHKMLDKKCTIVEKSGKSDLLC